MCSINGITKKDRDLVLRMNAETSHRGPDGTGIFEDDLLTLGHNRLSIIDLSPRGAQPMQSHDRSLVITYNGELYNYRELKEKLHYPWQSESDTEVILAAYEQWGVEAFKHFNGIFALAIWDNRRKELILARDHMGIKPLYYARLGNSFVFASEIKALLAVGVSSEIDREALYRYLRISDTPGEQTLFAAVRRLPAGHYAVIKDRAISLHAYWGVQDIQKEDKSNREWHDAIRSALDAAVARQLVSDRPVGVYLSGGIDSSAVLESTIRAAGRARTYTVRFEVNTPQEQEKFNSDAVLARRTAAHFGATHTEITLRREEVIPLFESALWHMDEPTGSMTSVPQIALARETSRDVAVVLGGDGGDELFGGYERYRLHRFMDIYAKLPAPVRLRLHVLPQLQKFDTKPGIARFELFECLKEPYVREILAEPLTGELLPADFFSGVGSSLARYMDADRRLLTDGSLLRTDKLSMAHSLEARVPILDKEMVELAARIPAERKIGLFETKKLFKNALRERLPKYLFNEEKRGWFAPSGYWLHEPNFQAYARDVLSPEYYQPTAKLFNWKRIHDLLEAHAGKGESHRTLIWNLLALQVWARRFNARI